MNNNNVKQIALPAFMAVCLLLLAQGIYAQIINRKRPVAEKTGVAGHYVKDQEAFLNNKLVKMEFYVSNASAAIANFPYKSSIAELMRIPNKQGQHDYVGVFFSLDLKNSPSVNSVQKTNEAYGNLFTKVYTIPLKGDFKYRDFIEKEDSYLRLDVRWIPGYYSRGNGQQMFASFSVALTFADGYKEFLRLQPIQLATAKGAWTAVYPDPLQVSQKIPGLPASRPVAPTVK
ncbi:MAG: hypothetical protein J7599_25190 [Niabella sp.]|nr:hypothetical protein [Niabella sp.]